MRFPGNRRREPPPDTILPKMGMSLTSAASSGKHAQLEDKELDMALHHAEPGEVVHLRSLSGSLAEERSRALVKSEKFEAIRLVLPAGSTIAEHLAPGYATIQCLEGRVTLEPIADLAAGDWIYLTKGTLHSLRAHEDSSLLLTIVLDPD